MHPLPQCSTAEDEFVDSFAGGAYRDHMRTAEAARPLLNELVAVEQEKDRQSHSAGFEAWMRRQGQLPSALHAPWATATT